MTHSAHEGEGQFSRVHCVALCREIGERLGTSLDQTPVRMSPRLTTLLARLRDEPSRIPPDLNS
jgi:hypothetical protein